MRRREFITALTGAAAWPLAGHAQQPNRVRRIGVLVPFAQSDVDGQRRLNAFRQGLGEIGWSEGKTIAYEIRYAEGKSERLPALATELVQANIDVIVTSAAQPVEAARNEPVRTSGAG